MLKKAGIVVAAAAAGLLAVSPLAFAGDGHNGGGHGGGHHDTASAVISDDDNVNNAEEGDTTGLVNVNDNEVNVPIQVCNNNVNVIGISEVVLGLLGSGSSDDTCEQSNQSGDTLLQNIDD